MKEIQTKILMYFAKLCKITTSNHANNSHKATSNKKNMKTLIFEAGGFFFGFDCTVSNFVANCREEIK